MKQDTQWISVSSQSKKKICSVASDFIIEYASRNSLAAIYSTAFPLSLKSFALSFLLHVLPLLPSAQRISLSCRSSLYVNELWLRAKVHKFYLFCAGLSTLPNLSLFDNKQKLVPQVIKAVCSKINLSLSSASLFLVGINPQHFLNPLHQQLSVVLIQNAHHSPEKKRRWSPSTWSPWNKAT